ncbi:hypothetical protein BHE74_00055717 [Ensete ventricosum]|nr:hypothetical protein BHE74_00055717 [Ensete ventricosum]
MAEKVNSGTNPGDLVEKVNSGTNPEDLAEKMNSGMNPEDLAKKVNSGTNPGDLAEKVNSSTNPEALAKKVNSGTNPKDFVEKVNSGTNPEDVTPFFSVISSPGSGGASRSAPEVGSSGASSGPPSSVDARVLRDMEVMKADHDLDTTLTEGSLAVIRGWYSIPVKFELHVPQPGQRPYSSDALGICISVDALEAGLRFPLHPLTEECLRWWRISSSQVAPNSWRYLVVFLVWGFRLDCSAHPIGNASPYLSEEESVLVGRLKGILSSSYAIKEMTELWLVEVDWMDLRDLRGMPKVSGGKAPPACPATWEVGASPAREAPKASLKRPVLTRRYKSRLDEGESRSRSKGKELAAPSEELDTPVESEEGGASLVHRRPRSMKDLFKMKVHKDDTGYYTLQMSDLGHQDPNKEMKA